jgi:hypothetical protein
VGGGGSDPVNSVSRSLDTTFTENNVDNYEIVFRTIESPLPSGAKAFYYASAKTVQGSISVGVYPGLTYDVLLLGGLGDALLAAGCVKDFPVISGQANVLHITLTKVSPQWDIITGSSVSTVNPISAKNDFAFFVSGLSKTDTDEIDVDAGTRSVIVGATVAPATGNPGVVTGTNLFVAFNMSKLWPLIHAAKKSTESSANYLLKFEKQEVSLVSEKWDTKKLSAEQPELFSLVSFTPETSSNVSLGLSGVTWDSSNIAVSVPSTANLADFQQPGDVVIEYKAKGSDLPAVNTKGSLLFKLRYRAFGVASTNTTANHSGKTWTIQNGLNDEPDAPSSTADVANTGDTNGDGIGGAFPVVFGVGAPVSTADSTINVDIAPGSGLY